MVLRIKANKIRRLLRQAKEEYLEDLAVEKEAARLRAISEMEENLRKARNNEPFSNMLTTEKPADTSAVYANVEGFIDRNSEDIWLTIGERKFKLELT